MPKLHPVQSLVAIFVFFLGLLVVTNLNTSISQTAQAQGITPTLYCLGTSCPIVSQEPDPTNVISLPPGTSVNPSDGIVPTEPDSDTSPVPSTITDDPDPCDAEISIQTDKKKLKRGGGFFEAFFEFLFRLIELLLRLGGYQMPNPDPGCNTPPAPAPIDPQPTDVMPSVEPTVDTSIAPQPSNTTASCTQADIQQLVNSVSEANIRANLQGLVQDDSKPKPNELISRHVSSPGNQVKVTWAKQRMASYGLQVIEQPFTSGGYKLQNAVARVNGSNPNVLYAVGGHIDTMNNFDEDYDPKQPAPGADDDGAAVAVAMEAGRVLKGYERCLKSSIDFVGWNDEEEEMNGSNAYIEKIGGKTFKGAISMNMIGYTPNGECLKNAVRKGMDTSLAKKLTDMNAKYNIGLNVAVSASDADLGDDAGNFWDADLPAVYPIECATEDDAEEYPGYHTKNDTTKNVNFSQLTKTTKIVVAALAELASQ